MHNIQLTPQVTTEHEIQDKITIHRIYNTVRLNRKKKDRQPIHTLESVVHIYNKRMMNFLKQMSLLHDIRGRSAHDTPRLIDVLEGIQIARLLMLDHANAAVRPLPDNATKLKWNRFTSPSKSVPGALSCSQVRRHPMPKLEVKRSNMVAAIWNAVSRSVSRTGSVGDGLSQVEAI